MAWPFTARQQVTSFCSETMVMVYIMTSDIWNGCSFGNTLSNFVATCSWPPFENDIRKCNGLSFSHKISHFLATYSWPQIYKLLFNFILFCELNENMPSEKLNCHSFGHNLSHWIQTYSWPGIGHDFTLLRSS